MKFKDLKSGYPLYVLDKEKMAFTTAKVKNVSIPHVDSKVTSVQMVVDVETDGSTYCVQAEGEIAYFGNSVIATEREAVIREIEAMIASSEQALSREEYHKGVIEKGYSLLAELDPQKKKEQATEERFNRIEESMNKMMEILTKLT